MLALQTPRRPAPFLACRGVRLRRHVRPNAFGNALGNSIAQGIAGPSQQERLVQNTEDMRDAEMARLMGLGQNQPAGNGLTLGGSGGSGLKLSASAVNAFMNRPDMQLGGGLANYPQPGSSDFMGPPAPTYLDSDDESLVGRMPRVGTVGREGAQGAWGIARSLAPAGANDGQINTIKNQLLKLNPELVDGVSRGQRYYIPDANTPQDLALGRVGDSRYTPPAGVDQSAQQWADNRSLLNAANRETDRRLAAAGPSGVDLIPGAAPGQVAPAALSSGRFGDGIELTYRQLFEQPRLTWGTKVEQALGVDWGSQSKLADSTNAINQLLNKNYDGNTGNRLSYSATMNLPVAPLGINNYDTSNLTYHDYRLEVPLCYRGEQFCTIPNLSPLVDYRSAPLQSWNGGMQTGPQTLVGGSPIIHSSNYETGIFTNQTMLGHPFHVGNVESNLIWKNDVLHLSTVGYGYGSSLPATAANYVIGVTYFGAWQAGVKYNVDQIRQSLLPQK